jgi:pimeloyl-ACP methyl ester carboxylesterase
MPGVNRVDADRAHVGQRSRGAEVALGLAYRDTGGAGAPLVLLHGIGGSSRVWARLVPLLRDRHRVISVDLPGHGASEVLAAGDSPALADLAEAVFATVWDLDAHEFHVCGHSAGGIIALELALSHPDAVASLAAIATDAGLEAFGWLSSSAFDASVETGRMNDVFEFALEADPTMALVREDMAVAEAYRQAFVGTDIGGFFRLAQALRARADLVPRLREVKPPVLALCGELDTAFREPTRRIAELVGGRYVEIAGSGHLPMVDQPSEVARNLEEHVRAYASTRSIPNVAERDG